MANAEQQWADAWDQLRYQLKTLEEMEMRGLLDRLTALVSELLDIAEESAGEEYENDPDNIISILTNALDQVINAGTDEVSEIFLDFAEEAGSLVSTYAKPLNLTLEQVASITNQTMQAAAVNNYDYIRQVIPQIRTDITQTFLDGIRDGIHPDQIQERLRMLGLPWSPTGAFSPGERAAMIAHTEFSRIMENIHAGIAAEAGVDYCFNSLNEGLLSHSDICIAATMAGKIKISEMKRKYMNPPRHPNCGCYLTYVDEDWDDFATSSLKSDIQYMQDLDIDYNAAVERFNKAGDAEVRRRENWRDRLQWENDTIRRLFPEGSQR